MSTPGKTQSAFESVFSIDEFMAELRPRIREWNNSWKMLRENWTFMVGIVMVLIIVALAILAPLLAPATGVNPLVMPKDLEEPKPPLIPGHPLGTGELGTDIYYGVIWGARTTIITSVWVVFVSAAIGLVLGAISGYYGGKVDEIIMRITDIFLSIPALIMAMAIAAIMARTLDNMMFALVIVWWPAYARLVRGQVLSVRENTYVEAAKAVGAKGSRIMFRHIVPNSLSPLVVSMTLDVGAVTLTAAALSFIGFGVPSGYAEWGRMVSDGQDWFLRTVFYNGVAYTPWWVIVFPGLMLMIFCMGCSLIGDGLRDVLDPRLRR